jgi:hypothetical protein
MPCLVDFYDCLRAWANPKSVGYPPWKKGQRLDCHEYYYEAETYVWSWGGPGVVAEPQDPRKMRQVRVTVTVLGQHGG